MVNSLINEIATGVILGGAAYLAMLALLVGLQTIALVSEGVDLQNALPRAAGRTWAFAGMTVAALGVVISQGFTAIDMVTNAVATAPLAASNLVTVGLGLLGIAGYLTDVAFVVGALSFGGFTVIMREVRAA